MFATLALAVVVGAPALKDKSPRAPSIEGEWQVESRFDCGKASTDQNRWVFSPGGVAEIRAPAGATVISKLTYTLLADAAGKAVDFLEGQGPGKADLRQGIYKIEGDTLTVSFTLGDAARPTSFDPANGNYVLVLKRVTK